MTLDQFNEIAAYCISVIIVILLINWLCSITPFWRDDTDEPGWFGTRSGVKIVTDHKTGCQYLYASRGGLTPRLDSDGKHICERKEGE